MRNRDELITIVGKCLQEGLDNLWDELEPEERKQVFTDIIDEYINSMY